jgi:hypothetical protein
VNHELNLVHVIDSVIKLVLQCYELMACCSLVSHLDALAGFGLLELCLLA